MNSLLLLLSTFFISTLFITVHAKWISPAPGFESLRMLARPLVTAVNAEGVRQAMAPDGISVAMNIRTNCMYYGVFNGGAKQTLFALKRDGYFGGGAPDQTTIFHISLRDVFYTTNSATRISPSWGHYMENQMIQQYIPCGEWNQLVFSYDPGMGNTTHIIRPSSVIQWLNGGGKQTYTNTPDGGLTPGYVGWRDGTLSTPIPYLVLGSRGYTTSDIGEGALVDIANVTVWNGRLKDTEVAALYANRFNHTLTSLRSITSNTSRLTTWYPLTSESSSLDDEYGIYTFSDMTNNNADMYTIACGDIYPDISPNTGVWYSRWNNPCDCINRTYTCPTTTTTATPTTTTTPTTTATPTATSTPTPTPTPTMSVSTTSPPTPTTTATPTATMTPTGTVTTITPKDKTPTTTITPTTNIPTNPSTSTFTPTPAPTPTPTATTTPTVTSTPTTDMPTVPSTPTTNMPTSSPTNITSINDAIHSDISFLPLFVTTLLMMLL